MSYMTWVELGKPRLASSQLTFTSFSGSNTRSLGKLCVETYINNQPMPIVFHVVHQNQAAVKLVLGRSWMLVTSCQLDWTSQQFTLRVNSVSLVGQISELLAQIALIGVASTSNLTQELEQTPSLETFACIKDQLQFLATQA